MQQHRNGGGEKGTPRKTAETARAGLASSAGEHHITAGHQRKKFLGRRQA
jgi:hypothetical protein